nr:LAT2 domain-containing protein [Misgurnus anguillicaudatus]
MIEAKSQQGLLLALISLTCLGCVYAFCLCCKKRSIMQQEDNILYEQSEFSEDNSSFVQSETVIRQNLGPAQRQSTARLHCPRNEGQQIHTSYQNLPNAGTFEPTYVDPIPDSLYVNEDDSDPGTYENVWRTTVVQHDSDSNEYENSDFLKGQADDDSDYVNEVKEHR